MPTRSSFLNPHHYLHNFAEFIDGKMGYELIITEKPKAAQKIAESLSDGKPTKKNNKKVPYYELSRGKKPIVVACAVGHLFQVAEKADKKFQYPIFDIEWKPNHLVSRDAKYTKAYLDAIKALSKDATSFTIATDYDVEGEVIGLNVLKYGCGQKDGQRMKFSTLTKPDLVEAYEHKSKSINWGQANAGVMRHQLDWIYGINLSRALTASLKKAGLFKIMSSGRVQGPALKIIVDRENEISAFKPEPFWQLELNGEAKGGPIVAWHEKDKFWDEGEAKSSLSKAKAGNALIKDVEKRDVTQEPPNPFDLTSLQVEAYRVFRISPKALLDVAQNLYISGLISYPRTSSQELPPAIGYQKIIDSLSSMSQYAPLCAMLKGKQLSPNNGKKTDPAHPAIYPTGLQPSGEMSDWEMKVYDLIVKRFLAVFGEPAIRQSTRADIDVNGEMFVARGITTVSPGWHKLYSPYVNLKEEELPKLEQGENIKVKDLKMHSKETQPPKRYTQASIVNELAKRNLGTKATRANIVDTLYQRGYVTGDQAIKATDLGIKTIATLNKYSPEILDEEMTRTFEEEMDKISDGEKDKDAFFENQKKALNKVLLNFKANEANVGKDLAFAKIESDEKESIIGECPKCGNGNLMIRRGKFGPYVACKNYPECKTTFKLPGNALAKPANKKCESCGYPMIKLIKKGKKPQESCINLECPTKKQEGEKDMSPEEEAKLAEGKVCPKCGSPLILRKSMYGKFFGCSGYPKCRHIERLDGTTNDYAKKAKEESANTDAEKKAPDANSKKGKPAAPKKAATTKKTTVPKKSTAKPESQKVKQVAVEEKIPTIDEIPDSPKLKKKAAKK